MDERRGTSVLRYMGLDHTSVIVISLYSGISQNMLQRKIVSIAEPLQNLQQHGQLHPTLN